MEQQDFSKYITNLDIKFEHLKKIDISPIIKSCKNKWFNQTLTKVNDSVIRLGILEGEYHWHKHSDEDEFFFVIEGQLFIDLAEETIELLKGQGITITKNILHRPRTLQKTIVLMVETSNIIPTGN